MSQDPPDLALVETQNWASRSHQELYDAVHIGNDPGRVGQLAEEWSKLGREMTGSADRMSEKLSSTESGWQGEAADAARSAIRKLADWSRDAGEAVATLADQISEQGRIMEKAKSEMPEPVRGSEGIHARLALTFAEGDLESFTKTMDDLHANEERSTSAHEHAVRVMTTMEASSRELDGATPRFTPPPDPIEDLPGQGSPRKAAARPEENSAPTQQESADGAATQKMTRPTAAPVAPQSTAQPTAAHPGPAAAGSDAVPPAPTAAAGVAGAGGAALAAQHGTKPAGAEAATQKMQVPKPSGPPTTDAPTVRAAPVKPASAAPTQQPPSRDDAAPKTTTSQNAPRPGGDNRPTRMMRPVQPPEGGAPGPGARRPARPNDRDRKWAGKLPPIPEPGEPTPNAPGPSAEIEQTSAAAGAAGGAVPQLPTSGGAPGNQLASGGTSGSGAPGGEHGQAQNPGAAQASGQPAAGGGMMGGGMMGGRGGGGQGGGQEAERKAKYVEGGPIVEVPGKDLPPPVIGEGKKKKKSEE